MSSVNTRNAKLIFNLIALARSDKRQSQQLFWNDVSAERTPKPLVAGKVQRQGEGQDLGRKLEPNQLQLIGSGNFQICMYIFNEIGWIGSAHISDWTDRRLLQFWLHLLILVLFLFPALSGPPFSCFWLWDFKQVTTWITISCFWGGQSVWICHISAAQKRKVVDCLVWFWFWFLYSKQNPLHGYMRVCSSGTPSSAPACCSLLPPML